MQFLTLYKTDGNWSQESKHPKNHLSNTDYKALCGIVGVCNMGGEIEYRNGSWYQNNPITDENDIKMGDYELTGICKKCLNKALSIIKTSPNAK
jgi:hypothetical protein